MIQPLPTPELDDTEGWVARHLDGLFAGHARRSGSFVGGQTAADAALAQLDITGYARRRSIVDPPSARGASRMSPYIRYGLVDLPTVHDHPNVAGAPPGDRFKYRSELLWQEYSRHWYTVFGTRTRRGIAHEPRPGERADDWDRAPWPSEMRCVEATLEELHADGWMVNQTRMWLASQWTVRAGAHWRDGEDEMFRHLLDGSRAANRLGWQWVVGGTRNRNYGFSRRQVLKRAPSFCRSCALRDDCPITGYPDGGAGELIDPTPMTTERFGPTSVEHTDASPDLVWITAESLGDADPALAAHPDLPVHFVFDETLLRRLRLDGKRLVFLADCVVDLATRRDLTVWRGDPSAVVDGRHDAFAAATVAVTHAPVPGFERRLAAATNGVELHPFPWLRPLTPALTGRLTKKRFPVFRDWCRLTKPTGG